MIQFIPILFLALAYGYLNGVHGSAIIVATIISSRALGMRSALLIASITIGLGPFLLGVAVVNTINEELLYQQAITPLVISVGLLGAIIWSLITLWLKIPSSISQALFGGLIGAAIAGFGFSSIQFIGLIKIMMALFLSPILGLLVAFMTVRITYSLCANASPHINQWFNRIQIIVAIIMGISFGANNGQKIIAILSLGLLATKVTTTFQVPLWTVVLSGATISLGSLIGGGQLIKTLGGKFYKIRPIHGFGAQLSSGLISLVAALIGAPVSGSQIVTSAILGAGSADRIQQVRWHIAQHMLISWLLTVPCSALMSAIIYKLL